VYFVPSDPRLAGAQIEEATIDLDTLEVVPWPLISRSGEGEALRLPLRWIAILRDQLTVDFAATGSVHTAQDALKLLMVGANVTMMASELLLNGVDRLRDLRRDLEAWLVEREYESVTQLLGSMSHRKVAEPAAFERAQYVRTVGTFSLASAQTYDNRATTHGIEAAAMPPAD